MKSLLYVLTSGSLMYVVVTTRPDIAHMVRTVSKFIHNPGQAHQNTVKHIFRYLVGTQDYCITFVPRKTSIIVGYNNLDYIGFLDSRKSTSRYYQKFRHRSSSWRSKHQECTAMSTTEAKYIEASDMAKEELCIGRLVVTFRQSDSSFTPVDVSDSQ